MLADKKPRGVRKVCILKGQAKKWSRDRVNDPAPWHRRNELRHTASLRPWPSVKTSGVSNKRSTAMNTAIGFPDEGRTTETPWQPPALSRHDQAECDYLESLFALDTVEGGDNE